MENQRAYAGRYKEKRPSAWRGAFAKLTTRAMDAQVALSSQNELMARLAVHL